ncbi:MAG: ABC transporter ATP-binding protein [Verrucomicrobiota bacterium]|nr:ABC transporter ATP-binding protein [Verrucomicrobiota bacterium]
MNDVAIQIKGVTKDFISGFRGVKLRAIEDINLEVANNEIYGLLGPNGSGKSTTIKIVLGLLRASKGSCHIYGQHSYTLCVRKSVGYLPEAPYFHSYLSGYELVRYYARICGLDRKIVNERVDDSIELVKMQEAKNRLIGTYSKGMLQRIGLAQALVHDPKLVILDEPTAGLDPMGTEAVAAIIRTLKDRGKTVLICSHLLGQIEGLCDRVAILHRGRLICSGRVEDLLQQTERESFIVKDLGVDGRLAVEKLIKKQGGRLSSIKKPLLSLNELFLKEVELSESTHLKKRYEETK